jgi:hypothetical protein
VGLINSADLASALKRQTELWEERAEYRPLGAILVGSGKLTQEKLDELLSQQTKSWQGQRLLDFSSRCASGENFQN